MIEAVRAAMAEEMERDDRVLVLGEDVGRKGGVFGATDGLYDRFGEARVLDTPLAESAIVGVAIGAALKSLRTRALASASPATDSTPAVSKAIAPTTSLSKIASQRRASTA